MTYVICLDYPYKFYVLRMGIPSTYYIHMIINKEFDSIASTRYVLLEIYSFNGKVYISSIEQLGKKVNEYIKQIAVAHSTSTLYCH